MSGHHKSDFLRDFQGLKQQFLAIGLTGGMGSGKSSAVRLLCELLQAECVDVDLICRHLLEPGEKGWIALRQVVDGSFFDEGGTLDRPLFRQALFTDATLRLQVNGLLHPLARETLAAYIQERKKVFDGIVIVETPLLFEAGWQDLFDRIVVVYANNTACQRRISERDQVSVQEAKTAMAAQESLQDKVFKADHVIDNSGSWMDTCLQILHLARILRGSHWS
jgi:dephospho-CoA kinase